MNEDNNFPAAGLAVVEEAVELTRAVHKALGLSDSFLNMRADNDGRFLRFKYEDTQRAFEVILAALSAQQFAPERVSVDNGELSDALGRVFAGLETELAAINQLRVLLASNGRGEA